MGGRGLGGIRDHINHFGYHIKEIRLLKAWGHAKLKGPGENTASIMVLTSSQRLEFRASEYQCRYHAV